MKKEIRCIPLIAGALLLLGLSCFLSPLPAGAEGITPRQSTKESGPVIVHEPQTFSFDCATGKLENLTTGAVLKEKQGGINDLPLLFPGDVVKIIPQTLPADGREQGMKGFVFTDTCPWGHVSAKDFSCSDDGQKHVQVNKTAAYGVLNEASRENLYIQEFEIVGNDIVKVQSWGGGHYTSTEDGSYVYSAANLEFVYLPSEAPVETVLQYSFNGTRDMTAGETAGAAYYTDEINTSVVFASDAIANSLARNQGKDMPVALSVRRPYIEGFYFSGAAVETSTATYRSSDSANWHGNFWEGWIDNQVEFHPWLDNWAGKTVGYHAHYPETAHYKVQLKYKPGRTLSFDACGGTIEGYPTRIYEADGRQYFNQELQDGTVDAQISAGEKYIPGRKGYVFDGWYEDAEYTVPVTSVKDTVNKYSDNPYDDREKLICRLYARWIPESHFDIGNAEVKGISGGAYTGKARKPVPVVTADGETLTPGTDYTVSYKNNIKVGTASATIKGSGRFHGTKTLTFKITKAANPMKVKAKKVTVKYSAVKNKAQTVAATKAFSITKRQGKVTYAKTGGSAKITVDKKTGKITIKKGTKKGTYKIKVKIKAAGNSNYKSAVKSVTVNIQIK